MAALCWPCVDSPDQASAGGRNVRHQHRTSIARESHGETYLDPLPRRQGSAVERVAHALAQSLLLLSFVYRRAARLGSCGERFGRRGRGSPRARCCDLSIPSFSTTSEACDAFIHPCMKKKHKPYRWRLCGRSNQKIAHLKKKYHKRNYWILINIFPPFKISGKND